MLSIEQNTGIVCAAKLSAVIDNNKSFFSLLSTGSWVRYHKLTVPLSSAFRGRFYPLMPTPPFYFSILSTEMWHQQLLMKTGYRDHTKIFLDITVHKTRSQSHLKKKTYVLRNILVLFIKQILQNLPSKCNKVVFFMEIKIISVILPQSKLMLLNESRYSQCNTFLTKGHLFAKHSA